MTEIKFAMSIDIEDPKVVKACAAFFATLAEGESQEKPAPKKKTTVPKIKEAIRELQETQQEEKVAPKKENSSGITVEQVRTLVAEKAKTHKTAIRGKLTEMKAANVTKLAEAHYPEFIEFLKGLE